MAGPTRARWNRSRRSIARSLRDYAARVFARDRLKIAVVGDIDAAATGRLVDRVFGGCPRRLISPTSPP